MSYTDCRDIGIAPQALQIPPKDTPTQYTYGAFGGEYVQDVYVNHKLHQVHRFPEDNRRETGLAVYEGLYDSGMGCRRGVPGIDNQCVCPGSRDQMPFQVQPPMLTQAVTRMDFSPFLPGAIPQLTPAAQKLVAERQPLPHSQRHLVSMDTMRM
jgi:hypothetical protein